MSFIILIFQLAESKTPNICGKPIDKGPCKALKFKYGFNRDTNRCEKFAYGGETRKIL